MLRKSAAALVALGLLSVVSSCRRTLPMNGVDAGSDGGGPSLGDGPRAEVPVVDAPVVDAPVDSPVVDGAADAPEDSAADAGQDATVDAGPAICPAGVAPVDVCGCGCCGGVAEARTCYYPARGETREAIPNPIPPPPNCALVGCTEGTRHICCADPGADLSQPTICGIDTSIEDLPRFTITRRDGPTCTTLELGGTAAILPITGPPGRTNVNAWRAPCDGSAARVNAIGGLGKVTPGTSGTLLPFPRYDVHVVLFFDAGTGVADAVHIDHDEVAIAAPVACTRAACPACGDECAFDTTYTYSYETGQLAPFGDRVILAPPAFFTHVHVPPVAPPVGVTCQPALPVCGRAGVDVSDVMAAFRDPDVQAAFAQTTGELSNLFFGVDTRPSGGEILVIGRKDGGGFPVGAPCPAGGDASCRPIPAGVSRLVSVLRALDQQQLADPTCDFPPL